MHQKMINAEGIIWDSMVNFADITAEMEALNDLAGVISLAMGAYDSPPRKSIGPFSLILV
jgi:hypothetical protein